MLTAQELEATAKVSLDGFYAMAFRTPNIAFHVRMYSETFQVVLKLLT